MEWEMKKLDELIANSQIGLVKAKKDQDISHPYRYFKMNNILNDNGIIDSDYAKVDASEEEIKKYSLEENDLLFNTRNSFELVGKTCLYRSSSEEITLYNNNILRIRFKNIILPEFAALAFSSSNVLEQLHDMKSGTTSVVGIYFKSLRNLQIPLPPLPEQRRLVTLLDRAFADIERARALLERNLRNAEELFESRLGEVIGKSGKLYKLSDVCAIKSKLVDPKKEEFQESLHVGGGNIKSFTGELLDLKSVKEEGLTSGKFEFSNDVVLYNKIRPYLVKVALPDFSGLCSADMYPLTPDDTLVLRQFLYYLLVSKNFTEYAMKGSARAGMPKVNRKHLFAYSCKIPKLKEQREIIDVLGKLKSETESLQSHYRTQLHHLTTLKQSLLQRAFAGKL